jgi:hypothetical protein
MDREHGDEPVTLEREPMRARGSLHVAGGRPARAQGIAWMACCIAAAWAFGVAAGVNEWTTTGPRGGFTLVAADPATSGRVFAAAVRRLYTSDDAGSHWRAGSIPYASQFKVPQALAFDPHVPGRIWGAFGGRGVSRSDDAGVTWTGTSGIYGEWILTRQGSGNALRLVVSPYRAGALYLTDGSLWTSIDSGAKWTRVVNAAVGEIVYDFALDPRTPGVVLAGTGATTVARSSDDGATWSVAATGLPAHTNAVSIAFDPGSPDHVYTVVGVPRAEGAICCTGADYALYASSDGGAHWKSAGLSLPAKVAWWDLQIVPVPGRPGSVFVRAGDVLYRTLDHGASWQPVDLWHGDLPRIIAAGPGGTGVIASGLVFGLQRSRDVGNTWELVNDGLPGAEVTSLALAGRDPFAVVATTTDAYELPAEILRSGGDGDSWPPSFLQEVRRITWVAGGGLDLGFLGGPYGFAAYAASQRTGTVLALADSTFALWRSPDGGRNWVTKGAGALGPGLFDSMAIAAADDSVVYAWGAGRASYTSWLAGGFARSVDGGDTWSAISTSQGVAALAIAPSNPRVAYRSDVWSGGIFRTDNAGASWTRLAGPDIDPTLYKFDVDPGNPNRLYASGMHLWRSEDGGATWTWIVGLSVLADGRFRLGAVDWSAPIPVVYAIGASGIVASTADPPNGPWSLVPGSGALGGIRALLVASAPGAPARRTLFAATATGVHEFTSDPDGKYVPVYRFYNRYTDAHFYTADPAERAHVLSYYPRFVSEGIAFWALRASEPGAVAVHRLYDAATGVHRYTGDPDERDRWLAAVPSLSYEGVAFHGFTSAEPGTVGAHRFTHAANGSIFVTANWDEAFGVREDLLYAYDGATFRVIQAARAGR